MGKRETAKERRARQRAEYVAANPHPYVEWSDSADDMRGIVAAACAARPEVRLEYVNNKAEPKPRKVTVDELAVVLFAVRCVGKKGLHYGQIDYAMGECIGKGCDRTKTAALLSILTELQLIRKIGTHIKGLRGTQYEWTPPKTDIDEWLGSLKT